MLSLNLKSCLRALSHSHSHTCCIHNLNSPSWSLICQLSTKCNVQPHKRTRTHTYPHTHRKSVSLYLPLRVFFLSQDMVWSAFCCCLGCFLPPHPFCILRGGWFHHCRSSIRRNTDEGFVRCGVERPWLQANGQHNKKLNSTIEEKVERWGGRNKGEQREKKRESGNITGNVRCEVSLQEKLLTPQHPDQHSPGYSLFFLR